MIRVAIAALVLLLTATHSSSNAAEIKFLCASALRTAIDELVPQFERSSGHRIVISYANVGVLTKRIQNGEAADVAIVSKTQIAALVNTGRLTADTNVTIAKVGVGVFVRKGARKPDISSVDAFKRSLLNARAIAFNNPATGGPAGIYLARLIERLGIADDIKSKIFLTPSGIAGTAEALAKGDADIGFSQMIDIAPTAELVGPLPDPIQNYTTFAAGISATSAQEQAGKALIAFITSAEARAALKTKGFEPAD